MLIESKSFGIKISKFSLIATVVLGLMMTMSAFSAKNASAVFTDRSAQAHCVNGKAVITATVTHRAPGHWEGIISDVMLYEEQTGKNIEIKELAVGESRSVNFHTGESLIGDGQVSFSVVGYTEGIEHNQVHPGPNLSIPPATYTSPGECAPAVELGVNLSATCNVAGDAVVKVKYTNHSSINLISHHAMIMNTDPNPDTMIVNITPPNLPDVDANGTTEWSFAVNDEQNPNILVWYRGDAEKTGVITKSDEHFSVPDCKPPVGSIGDLVWMDDNANGVKDGNEAPIPGVELTLTKGGTEVATKTTNANGVYLFGDLAAGTYKVTVDPTTLPASVVQTFDDDGLGAASAHMSTHVLAVGENNRTQDFGYRKLKAAISVEKEVHPKMAHTKACSNSELVTNYAGTDVTWCFVVKNTGETHLTNFVITDKEVAFDLSSVPNVLAPGASFTMYSDAKISADLLNTVYVTADPSNPAGTELSGVSAVNDKDTAAVATLALGSIGDRVWLDPNSNGTQEAAEEGIEGVTVNLKNSAGTVVDTKTTDSDGKYLFTGLRGAKYTVMVDDSTLPNGVMQTADADGLTTGHMSVYTLDVGENNRTQDFGYRLPKVAISIEKEVHQPLADGAACTNSELVTDYEGSDITWCFVVKNTGETHLTNIVLTDVQVPFTSTNTPEVLAPGASFTAYSDSQINGDLLNTVAVTATPATPDGSTITILNAVSDQDTAAVESLEHSTLGDRVWLDLNGDQIQDENEEGIGGVTLNLLVDGNVVDTQVTNDEGNYLFEKLEAGDYQVQVDESTLPNGVVQTHDADGTDTGHNSVYTLGIGEHQRVQDFGYNTPEAAIDIDKTVYAGHDDGASCEGQESVEGEADAEVTWCLKVTNTGATHLVGIDVTDEALDAVVNSPEILAPGESFTAFIEGTITADLLNTASVQALPATADGDVIGLLVEVVDADPANVFLDSVSGSVLGTSTDEPQVLGASTLAATGSVGTWSVIVGIGLIIASVATPAVLRMTKKDS